jgi:hypothetical protein
MGAEVQPLGANKQATCRYNLLKMLDFRAFRRCWG